jgi:hypothetical protein
MPCLKRSIEEIYAAPSLSTASVLATKIHTARVVSMRENHFRLPIRARTTSLIRMLLNIL